MEIKIKSVTDVITNSSSECYIIRTDLEVHNVRNMLFRVYNEKGYGTEENPEQYSRSGVWDPDISREDNEHIKIDYPVMCNVDDLGGILRGLFGVNNVKDLY